MSGGEQRRVALARALIARADLTILDEPTNHLDAETVEWLEQYLIDEHAGAVLLITHDRYLLDRVAERTLEVADGEVFSYDGGYELYLEQKAERMAHAARTEQNRQNFVRRELEWLRRQPKARTTKQKARIDRAEAAIGVQAPKAEPTHSFELDVARSGKTILETRGLAVEINGRTLIKNLEMFLTEGDRIGVVGANGIGKTTLLKTLLGEREPSGGKVVLGQNTKVAYFDQQRSGLENDKSIFENIGTDQSRIQIGSEVMEPRTYLERFGFDSHKQRQPVGSLSGGERARVALARMLRQTANLVVMDEPTNDLDVSTLGALESMLVELGATALVVTHDRWFLDRVATAILAFEGDGRVALYPGNYESFRRLSAGGARPAGLSALRRLPKRCKRRIGLARSPARRRRRRSAEPRRRSSQAAPDAIERAEQQVSSLEQKLADPSTYSASGTDVPRLVAELDAAKAEVARLMARWEELEAKKQG